MRLRPQQNTARRANGTLARFTFGKAIEYRQLFFRCAAFRLVGTGEVANDIDWLADVFAGAQPIIERIGVFR